MLLFTAAKMLLAIFQQITRLLLLKRPLFSFKNKLEIIYHTVKYIGFTVFLNAST